MVPDVIRKWQDKLFSPLTDQDTRKKEYGNLNDIKYKAQRRNSVRRHRMKTKNWNKYRQNLLTPSKTMDMQGKSIRQSHPSSRFVTSSLFKNLRIINSWNRLMRNLKSMFCNDMENITNMRVACEDFNLLSNNPRYSNKYVNRNKIIRDRIGQSRSFKKKLAEREYDKRQLEILKSNRSNTTSTNIVHNDKNDENNKPFSSIENGNELNNDKILLLQRQNKRLRKELLERESELRLLKKELKFRKRHEDLLKRDEILNLLSADSNTINKLYDKEVKTSAVGSTTNHTDGNILDERSRSFSPIRIDFSQYSR